MPSRPRINPLASALTTPKSAAYFGDEDCRRQSVYVHVGFMPASLAVGDDCANAVPAHVHQGHWRPWFCTRGHSDRQPRQSTLTTLMKE
jgi:hypothetical protein